jgi:hypothetical protein
VLLLTGSGALPASYTVGTGFFLRCKAAGAWRWTSAPSSAEVKEKSRAIPLLSLWAFMACSRVNFTFTFTASCSGCSYFTFRSGERLSWPFFVLLSKYFPGGTNQATTASFYFLTFDAQYFEVLKTSLNKPTIRVNKTNICLWMPQSVKDLGRLLFFFLVLKAYLKNWSLYSG